MFRNKLLVSVMIIGILLIVIISYTSQGRTRPTGVENFFGGIITPVQGVFYRTGEFFSNTFRGLFELRDLKRENENLKVEIEELRRQNRKFVQMALENNRLRNALDFKESNGQYRMLPAVITGKDPGNWYDVYTINKGTKHEIEVNDAIVIGRGLLVGRVIEVGTNHAKFMALIDERSSISILVNRTRDQGIVSGSTEDAIVAIMPFEADIVKGDDIVTSGYSTLPRDLYIGKVKKVEKQERKLQKLVLIEPAVDFKRLEEVFVVKRTQE